MQSKVYVLYKDRGTDFSARSCGHDTIGTFWGFPFYRAPGTLGIPPVNRPLDGKKVTFQTLWPSSKKLNFRRRREKNISLSAHRRRRGFCGEHPTIDIMIFKLALRCRRRFKSNESIERIIIIIIICLYDDVSERPLQPPLAVWPIYLSAILFVILFDAKYAT